MENKSQNDQSAHNDFVGFLTQFSNLLEKHLDGVREDMSQTVNSVMDSVLKISSLTEFKRKMSEAILVKNEAADGEKNTTKSKLQGEDSSFKSISLKKLEEVEKEKIKVKKSGNDKELLSKKANEAGGRLKKHMSGFKETEQKVETMAMEMVAMLSADDVVGQRLAHVKSGIKDLNQELQKIILNKNVTLPIVQEMKQGLLEKLYKSYTTEEEKAVYKTVFGSQK